MTLLMAGVGIVLGLAAMIAAYANLQHGHLVWAAIAVLCAVIQLVGAGLWFASYSCGIQPFWQIENARVTEGDDSDDRALWERQCADLTARTAHVPGYAGHEWVAEHTDAGWQCTLRPRTTTGDQTST